jgi:hypothetical protein
MKRLATIAVLVAIVGGSAFAEAKSGGIARQLSMGGSNAGLEFVVNPFLMHDPSYMLVNPAYQTMYKDYIWMNVGGGTLNGLSTGDNGYGNQFSGVSFAIDREWTVGAILSYDPSMANQVSKLLAGVTPGFGLPAIPAFINDRGAQTIPNIANVWELMGSYDGKDLDLGFAAMYGSSNSENKSSTSAPAASSSETEASASVLGFRAGMNMDLGSGSEWGASAALRLDKATDNMTNSPVIPGAGGEYSASGTEIQVQTRARLKVSNKFSFVPYALFATISAEPKQDAPVSGGTATTLSEKVTSMALAAGAGGEFKTSDFFLAGGLSFQYAKAKVERSPVAGTSVTGTVTYTAIPVVNLGAEWWFTNWLAGRGGYYRALASTNVKSESSSPAGSGSSETISGLPHSFLVVGGLGQGNYDGLVTLGLGLRFGGFALDATISEEALRRGFGVIGAQDNINTFGYITTSYNFE